MKELSMEEKAKRYDEALEKAGEIHNEHKAQPFDVMLKVFPELKESNDERIREALIEYFRWNVQQILSDFDNKEALAWLEKQGEHANFRNKIQVGDEVTRNEGGVLVNLSQLKRIAKPAEEYNITGIGSKNAQGKLGEMIKNLKPVNEVLEQKPDWNEKYIADVFEKVGLAKIAREQSNDNLTNALQDAMIELSKFIPQPKQEWSEEDEQTFIKSVEALEDFGKFELADWLKEHKNQFLKPQNTWKPSDEQMDALHYVTNFDYGGHKATLVSLYEQLKKLKG